MHFAVLAENVNFYVFDGKSTFCIFGRKYFLRFRREYAFFGFSGKMRFCGFGRNCIFPVLTRKCVFTVLAENVFFFPA